MGCLEKDGIRVGLLSVFKGCGRASCWLRKALTLILRSGQGMEREAFLVRHMGGELLAASQFLRLFDLLRRVII